MNQHRPSWDQYFMQIAYLVAQRSTCLRRQVGAVVTLDKRIISTGYNGSPVGLAHCTENPSLCIRKKLNIPRGERLDVCRALHAEQNAIIQAARSNVNIDGATMYITNQPCFTCAKMCLNAGIKRLIYGDGYPDQLAADIMNEANLDWSQLQNDETPQICQIPINT